LLGQADLAGLGIQLDRGVDVAFDDIEELTRGAVGGLSEAHHQRGPQLADVVSEGSEGGLEAVEGVELNEGREVLDHNAVRPVGADEGDKVVVGFVEAVASALRESVSRGNAEQSETARPVSLTKVKADRGRQLDQLFRRSG
jgi:hypothetical protein